MFTAATVAFPPVVLYSPVKRTRRFNWSCGAERISAEYSQLEVKFTMFGSDELLTLYEHTGFGLRNHQIEEPPRALVRSVSYRPPGTEQNLLNQTSLSIREKSFGLIFGRSGSGKTTLLQILAGLYEPTSGSICIQKYDDSGNSMGLPELLVPQRVGIVFQFPERYFLADTILEEVTFGWPRKKADFLLRNQLTLKLQNAINSVGLNTISLDEDPQSLSGGYKRRLALAIQLVQTPDLLLLDEPLAGLDWKARADVVNLLMDLKKDHTILVVSHDLRELYPLVDRSWRMEMGGFLKEEALPL